jgi:hypothetical protein
MLEGKAWGLSLMEPKSEGQNPDLRVDISPNNWFVWFHAGAGIINMEKTRFSDSVFVRTSTCVWQARSNRLARRVEPRPRILDELGGNIRASQG